jgi:hypothetical protein
VFCEVEVLRENDGFILMRPLDDFRIRGVGRAKFTPVTRNVCVLVKKFNPRKRKAIVNDDGHAG